MGDRISRGEQYERCNQQGLKEVSGCKVRSSVAYCCYMTQVIVRSVYYTDYMTQVSISVPGSLWAGILRSVLTSLLVFAPTPTKKNEKRIFKYSIMI